jgi:membrane-bound lytic murein transglycosylase D
VKITSPVLAALLLALLASANAGCALFSDKTPSVTPQVLAAPEDAQLEAQIDAEANLPPVKPFGDSESPSAQSQLRKRHHLLLDPTEAMPPDLEAALPGDVSDQVRYYLDYFSGRGRDHFSVWLSRSTRYLPMMRRIFHENSLPPDLVYLAMIESGFSTSARSHANAVGPWQFIAGTGRRYDLRISRYVDERRDPEKATRAAARYLKDLYGMFNSWDLALASYNAGENKIDRGVRRFSTANFWHIRKTGYLARETSNYVPQYLAALMIARNPQRYGFQGIPYQEPLRYETVPVRGGYSLRSIARLCGTTHQELRELNPALLRSTTPPGVHYDLRVPVGTALKVQSGLTRVASSDPDGSPRGRSRVHRVRSGQTLSSVARRYGVTTTALARANGLRSSSRLRAGARLRVPGARGVSVAQAMPADVPSPAATARGAGSVGRGATGVYVVQRGDTLQRISVKFNTTVRDLMRRNNLSRSEIKAGKRLIVPASTVGPLASRGDEA